MSLATSSTTQENRWRAIPQLELLSWNPIIQSSTVTYTNADLFVNENQRIWVQLNFSQNAAIFHSLKYVVWLTHLMLLNHAADTP